MSVNNALARIPLFISYPTIILSSNLIIPTFDELTILDRNNNDYSSIVNGLIRLILLPAFISSCSLSIAYFFNIINLKKRNTLIALFVQCCIFSQLNYYFNPIQTTCLSLLSVKFLMSSQISRRNSLLFFLKVYSPLFILCLLISYFNDSMNNIIASVIQYSIILFSLCHISSLLNNKIKNWESNDKLFKACWLTVPLLLFTSIYLISFVHPLFNVQGLMLVVFLGCLGIFCLSLQDIITITGENSNTSQNSSVNHSNDVTIIQIFDNTILFTGLMAIVLQYLSFNAIASSYTSNFLTLAFVVVTECISRYIDIDDFSDKESHHSHSIESTSLLREIVTNSDTRSIFSFLLLNTTFMFVQLLYSFRSKSLGLLSDSLHMALDCTSLLLGLIAGVLSKRPASDKYPFGLNYLETLAGFTNGVLLLGIVCGIFVQAFERLFNPVHIQGANELIVVATLGLLVNFVGLFALDHGGHSSDTSNENMRGIFLHVLADTLGSVGVVISTILIKLTHWHIFDPIASILIGLLILISSIPLLKSTASSILLRLDDRKHNLVKTALNQISTTPGISGYTTPRFWPCKPSASGHSHLHGHSHGDNQVDNHSLDHSHSHEHKHEHEHEHEHKHEHKRGHEQGKSDRPKDCNYNNNLLENMKPAVLVGYIHIQYVEGENSTIIKKRVEKIFENVGIKAWIQVEPQLSNCWCRSSSINNNVIPQVVAS